MKVQIEVAGEVFTLTDEHAASSYGIPVLVNAKGYTFARSDIALSLPSQSWYANAIARYAIDDNPEDAAITALVERFESTPFKW